MSTPAGPFIELGDRPPSLRNAEFTWTVNPDTNTQTLWCGWLELATIHRMDLIIMGEVQDVIVDWNHIDIPPRQLFP